MDCSVKAQTLHLGNIASLIGTGQDHDALPMTGRTQPQTVAERRHGERIGRTVQCSRDALQTMPVGIGLDHGHDLRWRSQLSDPREVMAQRAEMNGGDSCTAHDPDMVETRALPKRRRNRALTRRVCLSIIG